MSEYKNEVEYQKQVLKAEKWANSIKYIEARDGHLDTAYNSGKITRENQDGSFEVIQEAMSMDKIINILLLTIIFVFDPLAIALVIAANFAFAKLRPKTRENLYGEKVPVVEEEEEVGFPEGYAREETKEEKLQRETKEKVKTPNLSAWKMKKIQNNQEKPPNKDNDLTKTY